MFELLDKYVQLVGEKYVIQVVTDSASANVLAGSLLEAKYPHLYWSPCAAHCINLMFEDIFKLSNLKKTYERVVMINAYIYNRPHLLDIMRDFTKSREMVRPTKTRFATAFLTLKRFHVQKGNLRKMFTSERWTKSRYAREAQGKLVASYILMPSFWNHVLYIIRIAGPLVKVLRLVDGERKPLMGYIYEAMDRAKKAIAASFFNIEEKYKDVFALIDARWNVQLHRPLHAAGYYLNPEFYYANPNVEQDEEVKQGLYACIRRVVPTTELQDKILDELPKYKKAEGLFGIPFAIRHRTTKAPAEWWSLFGASTPNLQTFAIKILSLTCSSSGCERNWSIFEHLHSRKRNKLEQKRLNDLVFIKYNRALRRRYDARDTIDPIRLDEINESNEWLLGRSTLDSDEDNAIVFEDDELTWGDVVRAAGVDEDAYNWRSQSTIEPRGKSKASSSKASKKAFSFKSSGCRLNLIDEEEEDEEENFDDSNEVEAEYRSDENGDDGNESEEFEDYLVVSDDWI